MNSSRLLLGSLVASAIALSGCAASLRSTLSGKIGCPADEVVAPDNASFSNSFTAQCRGRRFFCSWQGANDSREVSCAPEVAAH